MPSKISFHNRAGVNSSVDKFIDKLAGPSLVSTGAIAAKRFVTTALAQAAVDSTTVAGSVDEAIVSGGFLTIQGNVQKIIADAPLVAQDPVKVGTEGRATKYTTAQTTLQTTITGELSAFTQPGGATTIEIVQAANTAGDRGRSIVIVGSVSGTSATETIALHATNTTTAVAGTTAFTKISGVYMADGAVLGASNVTVRASGAGATVCTLVGGTSELGADIPAQTIEAYCNEITVTGPNSNATFVTVVGVNSAGAAASERGTLDGASPSKFTTTTVFRVVNRICLGEFTNASTGAVKTNSTVDTAGMKCGVVLKAAAARGDEASVLILSNA